MFTDGFHFCHVPSSDSLLNIVCFLKSRDFLCSRHIKSSSWPIFSLFIDLLILFFIFSIVEMILNFIN